MPVYFGNKIRDARKAAGLTQRQLSEKINVSNTSISNWEKNLSRPDPDTIQNLCWALNVQPNYFFLDDEDLDYIDSEDKKLSPNRMQELRQAQGITMKEAAQCLHMPYTTYVNYEKGTREPNSETLIEIATFYNTSIDYLLGKTNVNPDNTLSHADNIIPLPQTKTVPLLGTIACGEPILADQNVEEMVEVPAHIKADFALRCKGDSMIGARIYDGDIVYIRQQPVVENGEIAAVLIDNEATLKRVFQYPNLLVLRPENPSCPEFQYSNEELDSVRVLGKATYFTSRVIHGAAVAKPKAEPGKPKEEPKKDYSQIKMIARDHEIKDLPPKMYDGVLKAFEVAFADDDKKEKDKDNKED